MLQNAVAHVAHLREQGLPASAAVEHAAQRFGVNRTILMKRVNGYVADSTATQEALAAAQAYLRGEHGYGSAEPYLRALYNAVTGEGL